MLRATDSRPRSLVAKSTQNQILSIFILTSQLPSHSRQFCIHWRSWSLHSILGHGGFNLAFWCRGSSYSFFPCFLSDAFPLIFPGLATRIAYIAAPLLLIRVWSHLLRRFTVIRGRSYYDAASWTLIVIIINFLGTSYFNVLMHDYSWGISGDSFAICSWIISGVWFPKCLEEALMRSES